MAHRPRPFRAGRRPLRTLLALPTLLVVGCDDLFGPAALSLPPPVPSPPVHSVEIVPKTVFTAPGETFQLPAWIKGSGGSSLRLEAFTNLEISWWASDPTILSSSTSNPAVITAPSTPGTQVDVQATVRRIDDSGGTAVVLDEVVSPMAKVVVAPDRTDVDPSDWVSLDHDGQDFPRALLSEGTDGGATVEDWVLGVVGTVRLGRNVEPGPTAEMAVFARRSEMELWPPAEPSPWSTAPDDVDATGSIALTSSFRELPVRFGLDLDTANVAAWAANQITYSFWLLGLNRLGIEPFWLGTFVHNRRDASGAPLPVADPIAACTTTNVNSDIAPFSITDATDPALYVLIVPDIGSSTRGWTCTPQSNWTGRVIFVSWNQYAVSTIAHEIGHVLALRWPDIETGLGHTNGVQGFDRSNLMYNSSYEFLRSKRDHLSIGQIYRMNADPDSWLNELLPAPVRMTRNCQITKGTGPCPALATDLER